MIYVYIFLIATVCIGLWGALAYNRLVKAGNMVMEAWSGVDVQLKRRSDLVPNLIETVKAYAGYEKGLFEKVTGLRAKAESAREISERGAVEGEIANGIKNVIVVAESYPQLKSSENFLALQNSFSEIEDNIQYARRYYNGAVRDKNILVESFPSTILAHIFGFCKSNFFRLDDDENLI